jgi:NADH-quinone oxidoreductase subunit L
LFALLAAAAFLTAFYMGRQVWLVFFGKPRSRPAAQARESSPLVTVPLLVLAALSALGGALNLPGGHVLTHWLGHTFGESEAGKFDFLVAGTSTALALIAIGLAYYLYGPKFQEQQHLPIARRPVDPVQPYLRFVFTGMRNKWWVDEFYDWLILRRFVALSYFLADVVDWRFWHDWFHDTAIAASFRRSARFLAEPIDLGIIDGCANGLARISQRLASAMRRLQTGYVRSYALWVFVGMVVILGYLILR